MFWSHVEYFCVFTFVAYLFLNGGKIRTGLDYFDKKNLEWKGENKDAQITNISFFFEAEDSCRGVIHFDMSYLHREKVKHHLQCCDIVSLMMGVCRRSQPEISPEIFVFLSWDLCVVVQHPYRWLYWYTSLVGCIPLNTSIESSLKNVIMGYEKFDAESFRSKY